MSLYYQKTRANEVLETFAELYLEAQGVEDHSVDDLDLPDYIRTYKGWENDSDEFWDYQKDIVEQIDRLAGEEA